MTLMQDLRDAGALRTLDNALAQSLRRLDPATPDTVLAAAALASLAVANGHAGFDPAAPQRLVDADIDWPAPETWRAALETSLWISQPGDGDTESIADTPLVFEHGLLYLRRYREYERRLALGLRRIGARAPETDATDALAPLFARLFPDARSGDDLQALAAAVALRHNLVLVTGGPGTGKTTTITRLLALLTAQAQQAGHPAPRISLAAPTGRAAERMAESVRRAVQTLAAAGVDAALLDALPTAGTTLHRLLGTIPDSPRFRHHADNPLPFDVVVVDEASMIDLPLMAKLVEAVADGARLVLLGDPDQLPSVEAGDVLSGILRAAGDGTDIAADDADALQILLGAPARRPGEGRGPATSPSHSSARHSRAGGAFNGHMSGNPGTLHRPSDVLSAHDATRASVAPATGHPEPLNEANAKSLDDQRGALLESTSRLRGNDGRESPDTSIFPGRRIHLQRGYRQSAALDLAPLATAVREGDAPTALSLLRAGELAGVHFHDGQSDPLASHREHLLAHWTALADTTDPAEALALAGRLRILTAVREGPQGARGLNARIEAMLSGSGLGDSPRRGAGPGYFHSRLLLVTENSYRHRLFNGDIGICLADSNGAVMAWFPGDDPLHPRPFHPAALPAHDSAFAMTVHKAQGSEFDEVWLVLPERFNRVLSRELVYTGMTRARSALHIAARTDVITEALARHASRWSGLGWRLGDGDNDVASPGEVDTGATSAPAQGLLF